MKKLNISNTVAIEKDRITTDCISYKSVLISAKLEDFLDREEELDEE